MGMLSNDELIIGGAELERAAGRMARRVKNERRTI
jgi:hypothetical protein